jgi:betaine-homocysteine S-methyltransferase
MNKRGILARLENGPVLGAEGYLFELERRGYVKAGPYVPEAVLDHPEAVRELHREFLFAGAEVMVAFTYYGHREKLKAVAREIAGCGQLEQHLGLGPGGPRGLAAAGGSDVRGAGALGCRGGRGLFHRRNL